MTYGETPYGEGEYGWGVTEDEQQFANFRITGLIRPIDYQMSSGTTKTVWLPITDEDDFVILQIAHPATCDVTAPTGWILQHQIGTGNQSDDLVQDIWTYIAEAAGYRGVTFTFSEDAGEKWIGGMAIHGLDPTKFIEDIAGNATGIIFDIEEGVPDKGFGYIYSKVIPELGLQHGFGYIYSKVIHDLEIAGPAFGVITSKVIDDLEADKGGFGYIYSEVTE